MTAQNDHDAEYRSASLSQETWETLVDSIKAQECTPFLGAGIAVPHLPTGRALATALASEFEYPLEDVTNLARVTQYIASLRQPAFVKRRVCKAIRDAQEASAAELGGNLPENYLRLARLELPIYVTTNYDDYLQRALVAAGRSVPSVEVCRWNDELVAELPPYPAAEPTAEAPMVFHLHGHSERAGSILVTEDDYIDFTVSLAERATGKNAVIPHFTRRALGHTNLLFIGYSLEDWNFRVMMRYLMKQQRVQPHGQRSSISIQLSDHRMSPERRIRAERFLEAYLLRTSKIEVYWGTATSFLADLEVRLQPATVGGVA
ncbi:SIR2 family protein [Amycolatopsis sp. NPDC049252]|uniref:SIR2 family NAD-dependent protein deacylase n=1 Tax=Amycolatopsis sp. NPDC049252 TaxID=3363933 RepID=UPI0037239618